MNNKILIFGNGYIANRLKDELGAEIYDGKINFFKDAQSAIEKFSPKIIINAVGYIGRNVDDCELDKEKTLLANTFVPFILAEAAYRNNARYIHISTGCIYHYDYSKDTPLGEELTPDFFQLFYSRSKIYSEQGLLPLSKIYPLLILRIRVPLDDRAHPKNLIDKLINYKRVIDLPNSVTYIPDFIQAVKHLIKIDARGIFNIVNKEPLVYSELMEVYKKYVPDFGYEVIEFKKLNSIRTNLVLSTKKLEASGFKVRTIHEVLEECVKRYLKY
ncbi:MAG: sugar nucleotide-binding protein [Candidatus Omnitrophica bacterium]|nr:sugar nucleotide-binding protein [Candidatus Omnitrophota bacterium]